jgi:fructose-1,6-bisphosphatase II
LLFEVSAGTVGGMCSSPTATTSSAAIDPVAAPWEGAPLAGFAPARAQLARLEATALAATRAAAMACQRWIGRGSGQAADAAATDAMRTALATAPGTGTVVIGEGVKDRAPMLYDGELVGTRRGPSFDIAVDPLECTTLCAKGLPGSLATIAFAEAGSMARLGPSFYLDKLVGPPATREAIDITDAPKANLSRVAQALEKPIEEVRVVVLDKPRHGALIAEIHRAGACVISPPDGDVAGALAPLLPGGAADLLMGIGGTPEGVMTACAVRALGGCMEARLAPRQADEKRALLDAGLSTERVYSAEDLVSGDAFFAATGVTGGELLRRPWRSGGSTFTHSVVVAGGSMRKVVEASVEQT